MSTHALHDQVLDAADALMDIAEAQMAEAVSTGAHDQAACWAELAMNLAAGIRAVNPVLHHPEANGADHAP